MLFDGPAPPQPNSGKTLIMSKKPADKLDARRILIVDDHPVFCEGLAHLVGREKDLHVCGQTHDANAALAAVGRLEPDLVLLDITMPGRNGLEVLKDLRLQYPDTKVLVVSMHDETLYAQRVLRAGGHGYIVKHENPDKLIQAIRHVLSGQVYISERMSASILKGVRGQPAGPKCGPVQQLSDREFGILRFIGEGKGSREIARLLELSPKTVDAHRAHIKQKLGLKNGLELTRYAVRWVELPNRIDA